MTYAPFSTYLFLFVSKFFHRGLCGEHFEKVFRDSKENAGDKFAEAYLAILGGLADFRHVWRIFPIEDVVSIGGTLRNCAAAWACVCVGVCRVRVLAPIFQVIGNKPHPQSGSKSIPFSGLSFDVCFEKYIDLGPKKKLFPGPCAPFGTIFGPFWHHFAHHSGLFWTGIYMGFWELFGAASRLEPPQTTPKLCWVPHSNIQTNETNTKKRFFYWCPRATFLYKILAIWAIFSAKLTFLLLGFRISNFVST